METASQTLGVIGEELAFHYLLRHGYKILLKNYECALGEIDLIARENGFLVFVEVKTRSSDRMGSGLEAVTAHKKRQIIKTANYYLKRYGIHNVPCRFDVLSVLIPKNGEACFDLVQNAFLENGPC